MLFSDLLRTHGMLPGIMSFEPNTGLNPGGSATADPPVDDPEPTPDDDKKYTKEDVERMALQRVKRLTKDGAAKDKKNEELEAKIAELNDQIAALGTGTPAPNSDGNPAPVDDAELRRQQGHWEVQRARYDSQIKELNTKLQTTEQELVKVRDERMSMERDLEIDKALSSQTVQCIDVDNARILVRDRVSWDPNEEEWFFRTKSGNILPVKEGIESELPDYLRAPALRQGGSGQTGGQQTKAKYRELEAKRKELEAVKMEVQKQPRNNELLVRASRLRREITDLEKSTK